MTDRAKKAISQLMYVCANTVYQSTLEVIEDELRRCRAETLREAELVSLGVAGKKKHAFAVDVAFELRRMAEEAER
jgi:hypothetical protein